MTNPSPAAQLRKVKKPLIERRRRERINEYLNELMTLVHEATGTKCPKTTSKMEKAEILEMTVDYLRKRRQSGEANTSLPSHHRVCTSSSVDETHSQPSGDVTAPPSSCVPEYIAGFGECARLVRRFLIRQHTGSSIGSANATPEVTSSDDMTHVLWRHLSEHVDARLRRSSSTITDHHFRLLKKSSFAPEVTSSTQPATVASLSSSSCAVSEMMALPELLVKPHPVFAVFTTSPDVIKPESGLPHSTSSTGMTNDEPILDATSPVDNLSQISRESKATMLSWCNQGYGNLTANISMFPSMVRSTPICPRRIESLQNDNPIVWRPWGVVTPPVDENGNYIMGL